MADDADDFEQLAVAAHLEVRHVDALADWVLAWKIFSREFFIHNRNGGRVLVVMVVEEAPAIERNFHHVEIVGLHDIAERPLHVAFARGFWFAVDPEELFVVRAHGKSRPGLRSGFDAGSGGEFSIKLAYLGADRIRVSAEHRWRQREPEGDDIGGIKAGIHAPQDDEAADHESGANQQDERHGHFGDHERALRAIARATASTAAFLERVMQMWVRSAERGDDAEENSRE